MDFIHDSYIPGETIAAIATPLGEGGVAIIRISGKEAVRVAQAVFSGPVSSYKSHTAHLGKILDQNGDHLDDALLIPMLGTKSFTGEDTVEIHCHGGSLISRRVLKAVLAAGARAARPGEFSFKACMNGKMDLAQAEGLQELISAKNERALDAAKLQLHGSLSEKISSFQRDLTKTAAILEAWIDFPEEGLEFATMDEISSELDRILKSMQKLNDSFHDGKILHDGLSLCLAGCPNVGKSSLMNALLDKERAIVSPIPGTTRDIVEDHLKINGLNIRLIDTAGVRSTEEVIEQEGIRRTKDAMLKADLVLLVLDAERGLNDQDSALLDLVAPSKTIIIWNKIDLSAKLPDLSFPHIVSLSAKHRTGLEDLLKKIDEVIWEKGPPSKEEILITNVRHHEALDKAIKAGFSVLDGLKNGTSPEFLSMDMRLSLQELGKIIGTNVTEDILSSIFSQFCIGK